MPFLMGLEVDERTQVVLDIMPRLRKNTWWSSRRYLHYLLVKFAGSQASDVRDKVYALLSMSEDAHNPARFYPCYEKEQAQVFRDTACFLIFGEILDSTHSFPDFTLPELSLPIIQLAEKALSWALSQRQERPESAQRTVELLIRRLNEGQLKTADLLLSLAKNHGQVGQMRNLLSHGDVHIDVSFEDEQDVLRIVSKEETQESLCLIFQRAGAGARRQASPPIKFRFEDDEDITKTINRLKEDDAPKGELLWAHVWAGNRDAVQELLEAGVDVNQADEQGHAAVHFATKRGHAEILRLLFKAGAGVNKADNRGNVALHIAVGMPSGSGAGDPAEGE